MLISTAQVPRHFDQVAPGFAYPLRLPRIADQARQCPSIYICFCVQCSYGRLGSHNPLFLCCVLPSLLICQADCKDDQFVASFS